MTNSDLCGHFFKVLIQAKVENVVVCAGARNAPLVMALKDRKFKVYNFFEERSAAFFALGLIKTHGSPVAVLTTSGTAAAELLPAAVEATYQGLPLILVTADRPKSYRGSGAPQSIEQVGIFSHYVEAVHDLDVACEKLDIVWSGKKPLHFNLCFDEPLMDSAIEAMIPVSVKTFSDGASHKVSVPLLRRPLVILGEIDLIHRQSVLHFINRIKAPVYAESMSHLKNAPELSGQWIGSSDQVVTKLFKEGLCDSVIRIGGVPTLRFWRDLEMTYKNLPVLNVTDLPFSGLARQSASVPFQALADLPSTEFPSEVLKQITSLDSVLTEKKRQLLLKYPRSEQALTYQLSLFVGDSSIYLGNSLPIRHWDQFAEVEQKRIWGNRGANGIDGQISSFLGWSEGFAVCYCFIGDLTALYDLASLGLTSQLKSSCKRKIVIMNNEGGQIFSRVFRNKDFLNSHSLRFQKWAEMWGWKYLQVGRAEDLQLGDENQVIEILPEAAQTEAFWAEWDHECRSI